MNRISIIVILFVSLLTGVPSSAPAQDPLSLADHPGGPWMGVAPALQQPEPEPSWSLRTGFRKGIIDQTLAEEIKAGPDIAVLRNGLSAPWPGMLAGFRESLLFVEPGDVAGLASHKPVLLIPSGGLAGLRASRYFQAGLAEYVRSGGVVICFTQQTGADFASLPVPENATTGITGVGWAEDSGSLFRASLLRASHPALASQRRTSPALETDGYLTGYPEEGQVLLARPDGRATLIVYPLGKGWVAATTLMSDYSAARGQLHAEEQELVRDLVLWAKAGGKVRTAVPGEPVAATLRISGPEAGTAEIVGVRIVGPSPDRRRDEAIFHLNVAAGQTALLSYSATFPRDAEPGIYHLQYRLHDGKRVLSPLSESSEGWFAVTSRAALSTVPPQAKPYPAAPLGISVQPSVTAQRGGLRLLLDIRRTGATTAAADLIARAAGQERYFQLTGERTEVVFDMDGAADPSPVVYAVYHASGRSLARGAVDPGTATGGNVSFDRPWYAPGQKARISATGLGLGAFSFSALGTEMSEHISSNRSFEIIIPEGLPSGLYPLSWAFLTRTGGRREGTLSVAIIGAEARCTDIRWEAGAGPQAQAVLRVESSAGLPAVIRLRLIDPAGRQRAEQTRSINLTSGPNDLSLALPAAMDRAGIWRLRYNIAAVLPEGPGFPDEPRDLSSGQLFIDAGEAAILALSTDRPVYYEARGPIVMSATAYIRTRAALELLVDGKRVQREKFPKPGIAKISFTPGRMTQGVHRIGAALSSSGPGDSREAAITFGARLPDLIATIQVSAIKAPFMEIGVGVANRGKVPSGKARASLYEGDPGKGGQRITHFEVPPLEPGSQHVIVVPWKLAGKAGARSLTAAVDSENAVLETDKSNNQFALALEIPDVLLEVIPRQESFAADDEINYQVAVANFTARTIPLLNLTLHISDPSGKAVSTESVPVVAFESGGMRQFDRSLASGALQEGVYLVDARTEVSGTVLSADSVGLVIRPTLSVKGSLAGTDPVASPCQPLLVRYAVRNSGTIPFTGGSVKLEIRTAGIGQRVHAIQLPLVMGEQTHQIARVDFPGGDYAISLRASVIGNKPGTSGDVLLDERPLVVRGPVVVTPIAAPLPRLLVWTGGESDTSIERALSEKLLREAFAQEGIYLKTVTSAEAFSREALTGLYTMYLLIDIDSTLDTLETLRTVLGRGHVVVLSGSNDRSRSLAEQFGFQYATAADAAYITFPGDSPLGLNGTLPFGKPAFIPSRKEGRAVAVYSNDQPAVLAATEGAGKLIVMPFSLIRSALAAGTSTPYSLLVRAVIFTSVPRPDESGTVIPGHLSVAAAAGQVAARISVPLPKDVKLLWANRNSAVRNGAVVFDLTVDQQPQRILYLLQGSGAGDRKNTVDVQYKCDGAFVSQRKME
ncbi:MAG: hypothetical protein OEW15_00930 [Nitrospirota bacterium]|nr:hypothetical protein [Nitrospirota bacterium]